MFLVLARHGNTFGPGDQVVWVGANEDLPLAPRGREQALELAEGLKRTNRRPTTVYCGPLKRTRQYAALICESLALPNPPIIDPSLDEIDYGPWGGLTTEQIQSLGAGEALEEWNQSSKWPKNAGWGASESEFKSQVKFFTAELTLRHSKNDLILLISSNGRLRYFLQLIPNAWEKHIANRTFKMRTGNTSLLYYDQKNWQVLGWNLSPSQLALTITP